MLGRVPYDQSDEAALRERRVAIWKKESEIISRQPPPATQPLNEMLHQLTEDELRDVLVTMTIISKEVREATPSAVLRVMEPRLAHATSQFVCSKLPPSSELGVDGEARELMYSGAVVSEDPTVEAEEQPHAAYTLHDGTRVDYSAHGNTLDCVSHLVGQLDPTSCSGGECEAPSSSVVAFGRVSCSPGSVPAIKTLPCSRNMTWECAIGAPSPSTPRLHWAHSAELEESGSAQQDVGPKLKALREEQRRDLNIHCVRWLFTEQQVIPSIVLTRLTRGRYSWSVHRLRVSHVGHQAAQGTPSSSAILNEFSHERSLAVRII